MRFSTLTNGRGQPCFSRKVTLMRPSKPKLLASLGVLLLLPAALLAQNKPYDVFPQAKPPYYRVRYEAKQTGKLIFPVNYTIWIPANVEKLRGVVVH